MIRLVFPAVAAAIALFLYWRRPLAYVAFTLWAWFLTPLVRRLVDLRYGWTEPNLVLLTPLLVASVSLLTILRPGKDVKRIPAPFVLCGLAVLYGFFVGMLVSPSAEGVYSLFNWIAPLLFGLHLVMRWSEYPQIRRIVELNFSIGVAVMGAYGIYQFFAAPDWDVYWLQNISLNSIDPSFGQPAPMGMRVWSTLNAPGPFANVMMAGLLLLLLRKMRLKALASVLGYIAFLLSEVRTAWLSWMIGFVLLIRRARASTIAKLAVSLLLLAGCITPIFLNPNVAPIVGNRLSTFSNITNDESFRERRHMYGVVFDVARAEPWGHGLRNQEIVRNLAVDSGILIVALQLGWAGAALYGAGIAIFLSAKRDDGEDDSFARAMRAICIAYLVQLIGGQIFVGVTGAVFWLCLGMATAAGRWHTAERRETLTGTVVPVTLVPSAGG